MQQRQQPQKPGSFYVAETLHSGVENPGDDWQRNVHIALFTFASSYAESWEMLAF